MNKVNKKNIRTIKDIDKLQFLKSKISILNGIDNVCLFDYNLIKFIN